MPDLLAIRLDAPPIVIGAWLLAALVAVLLVLVRPRTLRDRRRLLVIAGSVALGAAALVVLVSSILVDVAAVFGGAPVPWGVRLHLAAAVGLALGAAVILCAPRRAHPGAGRRVMAAVLIVLALLAGTLGANAGYGSVRTLGQLFPAPLVDPTSGGLFPAKIEVSAMPIAASAWSPPAELPASGSIVRAEIPAPVSGFTPRPATIYLPPAALVANPPTLPVVVMLSGQPGDTGDVLASGQFHDVLDAFATAHGGLAPIVVAPDQLGAPDVNPLCADTKLGNSKTYLEVDVPTWIQQHLNVATDRMAWTFGGFSQGATCTFQIGLDQPERYATNVAIAAELTPTLGGDAAATLAQAFDGDQAAYDAITPRHVMQSHAPYRDTTLIMGVGQNDAVFTMWGNQLASWATASGLTVQQVTSPGTSHDFNTVRYTLEQGLPVIMQRAGVTA